jgi:carbonic anhydrase/acetyltransferase-like protein (isoleucine patch superfamily)
MGKAWIAPNATVVGDVTLQEDVSIWYGAVLRGDSGAITVGRGTNIQDNCVLHEKTTIGDGCTVGHGAIVHGCTIGNRCMVGMGAMVLTGAVIGDDCLIGAGALVTGKMNAPAGSVLLGSPAKIVKQITPEQMEEIRLDGENYIRLAQAQAMKEV